MTSRGAHAPGSLRPVTHRSFSAIALGALTLGVVAVASTGLAVAPAAADQLTPSGEVAMAQIAGCAAGSTSLLVAVVVDESGSLRQTDPPTQRVNGVNSVVDALAELRSGLTAKLDVEASLAVFADRYTPIVPWLRLDEANAAHLKSVSSAELPGRNKGAFTDYRTALTGAQASLDARAAELGGSSCKVLLWFTDGALDVSGGGTAAALTDLCAPNGIVDQVRAAHVAVIALALFQDQSGVTPEQREQLRAVAEGAGAGVTCGQSPIAAAAAAGAYLSADNATALRRAFAGVGALISGASPSQSVQCPSTECPGDAVTFGVDRGVAGFQLIVDSPDDAARLTLTGPGGQAIALAAGGASLPGGKLDVTGRDGLTTATATFDAADGADVGSWNLTALDVAGRPSPVAVDVLYFWGAQLTIDAPKGLLLGADSPVTVRASVAGQALSPDWYKSLTVELRAGDEPVALTARGDGTWTGTLAVPAAAPADVTLTATATAVSSRSGVHLTTASASAVLPTRLAPSYPTLVPARLDLPAITTAAGASATLTVRGGEREASTVCLGAADLAGPARAGAVSISADAKCIDVAPGQTTSWTFTLSTAALADGAITGHVRIVMTGAVDSTSVDVPVGAAMTRAIDGPVRWGLFAGLVALAALTSSVMAMGGRRRVARTGGAAPAPIAAPDGADQTQVLVPVPGPGIAGAGDEFDGLELAPGWTAVRSPAVEVVDGELRWPIEDAGRTGSVKDAGLLLRNAPAGNWTAETKLTLSAGAGTLDNAAQVGLVAYIDSNLITCLSNAAPGGVPARRKGDRSSATTWLRLTRRTHGGEHRLWASTSLDGATWLSAGMWMLPPTSDVRVGLTAHGTAGTTANFNYLRFYTD